MKINNIKSQIQGVTLIVNEMTRKNVQIKEDEKLTKIEKQILGVILESPQIT